LGADLSGSEAELDAYCAVNPSECGFDPLPVSGPSSIADGMWPACTLEVAGAVTGIVSGINSVISLREAASGHLARVATVTAGMLAWKVAAAIIVTSAAVVLVAGASYCVYQVMHAPPPLYSSEHLAILSSRVARNVQPGPEGTIGTVR
jgi:hypothetical protein